MLTQCPIQSPNMFRYAFVAREPGTKFYHSHAGHNKINGIYGPMIVRESEQSDPNSLQYECDLEEHTIMLADWLHAPAEMYVPGLQSTGNLPDSILLNGRGQYRNSAKNITTKAPLAVFRMHGCRSYRFRIVNACNGVCAIQLQVWLWGGSNLCPFHIPCIRHSSSINLVTDWKTSDDNYSQRFGESATNRG